MSDEGFHEIQLNGKQLVFLFMAATVVSVVIFLCGVLVGRGVRDTDESATMAATDIAPDSAQPAPPATTGSPSPAPGGTPAPTGGTAPPAEELSYAERLLRDTPPAEKLKETRPPPAAPPPAPAPAVKEPIAAQPTPAPAPA